MGERMKNGFSGDTIAAIATAPGAGGIGICRLSGSMASQIAFKIFERETKDKNWTPQKLYFGRVKSRDGETIDDGYAVFFPLPHSYTGEDTIEFQLHGSTANLERVMELLLENGARLANPGEFTERAYLNGKLDLLQAEAVAELIEAGSGEEARAARRRLDGMTSSILENLRQMTIEVLAEYEADVDFPDEELSLLAKPELFEKYQQIQTLTDKLLASYRVSQKLHSGFLISILGKTNAGKSSLFNSILQFERAIVTPQAGTTRDVLREELVVSGRRVRLQDTAGLRNETSDEIESMGMERSRKEASQSDLILYVVDSELGMTAKDRESLQEFSGRNEIWVIFNKVDLRPMKERKDSWKRKFSVSAKTGEGIEELLQAIEERVTKATTTTLEGGIGTSRQYEKLQRFRSSLERARSAFETAPSPEFLSIELRQALEEISSVLGVDGSSEVILDEIFSRFCIGK